MIEGRATARYVRGSAQKAKLVMDLIRGRDVNDALARLRFSRKRVARDVSKVLRSAIANAQQKEGASGDVDRLYVGSCYANSGPSMKRVRAAPMGRAFRIIKRTSHLTVMVREREETVAPIAAAPSESTKAPASRSRGKKKKTPTAAKAPVAATEETSAPADEQTVVGSAETDAADAPVPDKSKD